MKSLLSALAASLNGRVTTLATLWRLERTDGALFGFTDHDADLQIDGLIYRARSALASEGVRDRVGGSAETTEIAGALQNDVISEADLMSGLWDDARIRVTVVDWTDTSQRAQVFSGVVGAVRMESGAFTADVAPLRQKLEAAGGRFFTRLCDAQLGDARCGVDITASPFRGAGAVQSVEGRSIRVSGLTAFQPGWFNLGIFVAPSGERRTVRRHSVVGALAQLELDDAPALPLAIGASVVVTAGCDKRAGTCAAKFANIQSFRGFPHMMGAEAVIAGVDLTQPLDGASRWRR